jgi:hypothetical protein
MGMKRFISRPQWDPGELRKENLRNQKLAWGIIVGLFFFMAVWPLWSERFPPMQDYPQHLFQTQVLRAYNDTAFDYSQNFEVHLKPVYASFYLTTLYFSWFLPIEIAGKLSLSIYFLLVAVIVVRLGRRRGWDATPWGALLFFPLAFNQQYFLGNVNYLLALPILILTLLDYEDFLVGIVGAWPIVRHSLWQVALIITHPFTFSVYVFLAVVAAFMVRRRTPEFKVKVLALLSGAMLLFLASWVISKEIASSEFPAASVITWLSPKETLQFFVLMFNGMQRPGGADYATLVLWGSIFTVVLGALIANWKERGHNASLYVVFLIVTILGLIILPFRIGGYTYVNLRTSAIIYFLLALLVARVRFRGWWLYSLIGLLCLCMLGSGVKQARISSEISEIVPIVSKIPSNSRILPLVFDNDSPELDKAWFDIHLHDHNYYHILVGGGFNPYLFSTQLTPVHYRRGQMRRAPGEYQPDQFSRKAYSLDYQYFLVRRMPKGMYGYMSETFNKVCDSGAWALFEHKRQ